MPDAKNVLKIGLKFLLCLIGAFLIIIVIANYEGTKTYSKDIPLLGGVLVLSFGLIFLGFFINRNKNKDASEVKEATNGQRFMNFCVDYTVIYISTLWIATANAEIFFSLSRLFGQFLTMLLLTFCVVFGYYFSFECIFQRTIGKFVTLTKVVSHNNNRAGAGAIALRTLLRLVPFEPLSAFTDKGLWHDRFSKTSVNA